MNRAAVLAGLGTFLPPTVVTNADLAARLDTTDEWIRTRTGIEQRHVAEEGMLTSDLATEAGANALKSAGLDRVGAVLVATTTPDRQCPATAPLVAERLGLRGVAAFDVAAVCSGFVYGLATGAGLVAAGTADSVLVIGADVYSTILDPDDRGTAVVFGDGAGAVVLRAGNATDPGALGRFDLGSDGSLAELITIPPGGRFTMAGRQVFQHAVQRMSASAQLVLEAERLTVSDIDHLVAHQANARILASVAERMGLAQERVVSNIARVGNTSAASIPLALADSVAANRIVAGQRVLLSAFGGGATWGSTVLRWPAVDLVH